MRRRANWFCLYATSLHWKNRHSENVWNRLFPSAKRPKLSKQFAQQTTQICMNFTTVALIRIITHRRKLAIRQQNRNIHHLQMLQTLPYFGKRLLFDVNSQLIHGICLHGLHSITYTLHFMCKWLWRRYASW